MTVQLRLLDKADKEILKLPRTIKGAIYEFQHKFRQDPSTPGLHFKQLKGGSRLYSARVTQDYRALLLKVSTEEYLLVAVKHRSAVYDNLDKYAYQINPISGGIEFVDIAYVEGSVLAQPSAKASQAIFAAYSADQLTELGVAEPLLPLIAKITNVDELLGLAEFAPQLTAEVLLALYDGRRPQEVRDQVTAPVKVPEPVDTADFEAAVVRPATVVTTDDTALQAVLEGDFARWQVFLHPLQRQVVERSYSGSARVSGGPGTGKTIAALHRVRYLADRLEPGGQDILLTTFNKNLATDLRHRLLELGGSQVVDRVDVVNIDRLAARVAAEAEPGVRRHWMDDVKAVQQWRELLFELGAEQWSPEFLHEEWSQVVLGQALNSRADYFSARRVGRGRPLNRVQRGDIWRLVEQFTKRIGDANLWTYRQVAARAASIERERAKASGRARYRHVVVDEAQDLSVAHWTLLRSMVAPGPNDLFLAGDTHQRIYNNYVSLASLGINIRGRSARLTLSYRSTHQILAVAEALLGNDEWDDLDGGTEDLAGYRSVLRGQSPVLRVAANWQEELDGIVEQVKEWTSTGDALFSIGVAVPERRHVGEVEARLTEAGVRATAIGPDGPREDDAVHIGTLHRFKGLEYQRMILAGICDGVIPGQYAEEFRVIDPLRYRREIKQARSLLFVAATRARDSLVISWHGKASPFLPPALSRA